MKGNRQGSLSRSITRRSDQNREIKCSFLFCDFAGSLSKKSGWTFFDKLTGRGLCRALCFCCIGIGMDQESKTAPCAARQ